MVTNPAMCTTLKAPNAPCLSIVTHIEGGEAGGEEVVSQSGKEILLSVDTYAPAGEGHL